MATEQLPPPETGKNKKKKKERWYAFASELLKNPRINMHPVEESHLRLRRAMRRIREERAFEDLWGMAGEYVRGEVRLSRKMILAAVVVLAQQALRPSGKFRKAKRIRPIITALAHDLEGRTARASKASMRKFEQVAHESALKKMLELYRLGCKNLREDLLPKRAKKRKP